MVKEAAGRMTVHILDSRSDDEISNEVIRGLDTLGVDATAPPPQHADEVHAVIVLLSPPALKDPAWLSRAEALRGFRLVPVLLTPVDDNQVPSYLREINWVIYRPHDAAFIPRLFTAINTDLNRYRDSREVRAQAARWFDSGQSDDLLIDSVRMVKSRKAEAWSAPATGPGALPASVREYLTASDRYARRLLRQRVFSISWRTGLTLVVAATVAWSITSVIDSLRRSNNSVVFATSDASESTRPDITAFKAGASLIDAGEITASDPRFRIVAESLSRHWPRGILPPTINFVQYDHVFLADSATVRAVDSGGDLVQWAPNGDVDWIRQVTASAPLAWGTTPDGTLSVIATSDEITVVHSEDWSVVPVRTVPNVAFVAVAEDTNRAVLAAGGSLWSIDDISGDPRAPRILGTWDSIMSVTSTIDGRALAIARTSDGIVIVRDDGQVVRELSLPEGHLDQFALSSDGHSVAAIIGRHVWTSRDGAPFSNSGVGVPGVPGALAMTNDGLVVLSDRTSGVRLIDSKLGISLGDLCIALPSASHLVVGANDDEVFCSGSMSVRDVIGELRPISGGARATAQVQVSGPPGGATREIRIVDGYVKVSTAKGTVFAYDAVGAIVVDGAVVPQQLERDTLLVGALLGLTSTPTSVAIAPDGSTIGVGLIDGTLIEADVTRDGSIILVGTYTMPDHSPVTGIEWSESQRRVTVTTIAGNVWMRPSCSGCFNVSRVFDVIRDRAWLCYLPEDAVELGSTARSVFALRECAATPEVIVAK